MLDHEDLKWIATTSTELNSLLQQVARYADLARQHKGASNFVDELDERIERASKMSQALFDRVTNSILADATTSQAAAAKGQPAPAFSVLSLPAARLQVTQEAPKLATPAAREFQPPTGQPDTIPSHLHVLNGDGAGELILLVDDELEISELASEMLADEGYKVIHAKEGFEALRIYGEIGPQIGLVILDFFLPVMDGDAVFDELRALNPDVNVVLSSGFAEQTKLGAMLAQGLRGFIPKPYTREKLLAQVRSTLEAAHEPVH